MIDFLQVLGSIGGVGAVFGIVVFFLYRYDRRISEDRLTKLLEDDQKTRNENTKALTELTTLLYKLNGK